MSLTYGGTTYRSLEEQVRKNMEDISTGAESLAALTDKVDNLKTGGTKVSLTFPEGAKNGTVTDEQLATLQENDENYIEMVNDKELYYLNDNGHEEGFLTYSHVGIENSKATIKTLTITVSTKSFVIVTTVVPTDAGGGKVYLHVYSIGIENQGDPKNTVGSVDIVFYSSSSTKLTGSEYYRTIYAKNGMARVNCTIGGEYTNYTVEQTMYMNFNESKSDYTIIVSEIFNPANTTLELTPPTLYYKNFTFNITEV